MTKIYQQGEVVVHIWNGTYHDTWHALIRVEPSPGNLHADLNVFYYDGSPQNVNGMLNVETVETNEGTLEGFDYWTHAFSQDPNINLSRPWINPTPAEGDIVWLMLWDSGIAEHIEYPAVVTAVNGTTNADLDLRYIMSNGTTNAVPNVAAYLGLSDITGEDFWFYRRPVSPLPEAA